MLISTAIITGFKHDITEKIFGFWGHIHITDTRVNLNVFQAPIYRDESLTMALLSADRFETTAYVGDDYYTMESKGGVQSVSPYIILPGIIKFDQELEGIQLKGVDHDFDWSYLNQYIIQGQAVATGDSVVSRDLLISQTTADRMRLTVGDDVELHFVLSQNQLRRKMRVAGIYRTGLEEYDKMFALCDMRVLQQLLKWDQDQVGGYEVRLENYEDMETINAYLYEDVLDERLYAETLRQRSPQIFDWLNLQNINETVILTLLILVSIINMITVMIILILERTRMIGTLKAIGGTDWFIRKIFLIKAGRIILGSLVIGNIIGLGFCLFQKYTRTFKLSESDYYLSYVPIKLEAWWIIGINLGAAIIIFLCLIIPTYIISKIDPIKALRFK